MDKQIKARKIWVNLYFETKDAGYVCGKCGISRPTLRKWHRRYLEAGVQGLVNQSKKPHVSPNQKAAPISFNPRIQIQNPMIMASC